MKVIVLAGGRGTRLWPVSRQLYSRRCLCLPSSIESLLASAYVGARRDDLQNNSSRPEHGQVALWHNLRWQVRG